jgi:hypothetical protein
MRHAIDRFVRAVRDHERERGGGVHLQRIGIDVERVAQQRVGDGRDKREACGGHVTSIKEAGGGRISYLFDRVQTQRVKQA